MPTHLLSDMIVLFQSGQEEAKQVPFDASSPSASGSGTRKKLSRYNHVLRKLEFYIAHVLATPIRIMENVSDAALSWSRRVQAEYSNTNIMCQSMIINTIVLAGTIRKSTIEAFFSQIAATSYYLEERKWTQKKTIKTYVAT